MMDVFPAQSDPIHTDLFIKTRPGQTAGGTQELGERRKDDEGGKGEGKRQYIVTYTGLSELQQMASCGAESKDDVVIAFHMKDLSLNRCCGKYSHCQSVPE